jgi:PLP dependent protein
MTSIGSRVSAVRSRIDAAARHAGRDPSEVRLVAVSKGFPAHAIVEALHAGVIDFGENRAQELARKMETLGDRARWHFVGALQRNKVRTVVGATALIHSIDRTEVADAVSRRALALGRVQPVLVEVNVSGEASKSGVPEERAPQLAEAVAALEGVELKGFMTIPPWGEDPEAARPVFERLASLRRNVSAVVPSAVELSMGMTHDFEVAVECGATIVRIGEAIFGSRPDQR